MLRLLVLTLLLANIGYFVWSQGLLAAYGLAPARQAEPERLAQQIRPEAMQLIAEAPAARPAIAVAAPPAAAPAMAVAAPPPVSQLQCLQAGPFTEKEAAALDRRLRSAARPVLSAGNWVFETPPGAARWIIYMGRYISQEALARRRTRLEQLGIAFETPVSPRLMPGLSLGNFGSKAEAENALAQMTGSGLRSAKVVMERPELPSQWLKFPIVDESVLARLESLKPLLADKALQPCQ